MKTTPTTVEAALRRDGFGESRRKAAPTRGLFAAILAVGLLAAAAFVATTFAAEPVRSEPASKSVNAANLPTQLEAQPAVLHEPLSIGDEATAPHRFSFATVVALACLPPIALWLALAWHHSQRTAPDYRRRRARRKMRQLFSRLRNKTPAPADLETWFANATQLWGIDRSTPTTAQIASAAALHGIPAQGNLWGELWEEAEAALYSKREPLRDDWVARASTALGQVALPRIAPWFPVSRAHWLPGIAVSLALGVIAGSQGLFGGAAAAAYQRGAYAEARAAWLAHIETHVSDWAAHNNLALTYAQEDVWGTASAHWTTALLLNPHHPAIASNLRLGLTKIEGVDPTLHRVLDGAWYQRSALWLTPAHWQFLAYGSAALTAAALCALVTTLYFPRGRAASLTATGVAIAGGLLAIAAGLSLQTYGMLAKPQAAFVTQSTELRSLPSDIVERQQKAPLLSGAVVLLRRSFLGWDQIETRGQVLGWVRRESVVPLYRNRDAAKPMVEY